MDLNSTHKGFQVDIYKQGRRINWVHGKAEFCKNEAVFHSFYIPNVEDRAGHTGGIYKLLGAQRAESISTEDTVLRCWHRQKTNRPLTSETQQWQRENPPDNIYLCSLSGQSRIRKYPRKTNTSLPSPTPCYRQIRGKIFQAGGRITHEDGNMADKQKCHLKKTSRLS